MAVSELIIRKRQMNSRERLLSTISHQEPDRIPFDLGSTQVTGIHKKAYDALRNELGLSSVSGQFCDRIQGLVYPDDDLVSCLGVDVRGLFPLNSHNLDFQPEDGGAYWVYHDEWGIVHHRPKLEDLYYSIVQVPLSSPDLTPADIESYKWPDLYSPWRIAGLRDLANSYRKNGYAVVLKDIFTGIFEMAQRILGVEECLIAMSSNKKLALTLFDKLLELKLNYWEMALGQLHDVVDVIALFDDFGTQTSQLISPNMFRDQLKPRIKILIDRIKYIAPDLKCFFHSCGNVRPILPDFIEIGIDILNPVHIRAKGMEPTALKIDFGDDLVFWGGGIDTQGVLPRGSPAEVKDEVRRNIEALAPGGGFVFNTIHNIQADVPPQNILAMWDALNEYGKY